MSKKLFFIGFLFLLGCSSQPISNRSPASWHSCYESLSRLIVHSQKSYGYGNEGFHFATNLKEMQQLYGSESFFDIQNRLSNADIKKNNTKLLNLLKNEDPIETPMPDKKPRLTKQQAQSLYNDMERTPCVADDSRYQRAGVELGYCFGRAIVAHFHGLRRGIHPEAVKKIWVVGDMDFWGHHVATIVKGQGKQWYVVDNVTGLVSVEDWIRELKGFKHGDKDVMFFVTDADRFGPDTNYVYDTVNLFNVQNRDYSSFRRNSDYYKGFFRDFFDWLDKEPPAQPF